MSPPQACDFPITVTVYISNPLPQVSEDTYASCEAQSEHLKTGDT